MYICHPSQNDCRHRLSYSQSQNICNDKPAPARAFVPSSWPRASSLAGVLAGLDRAVSVDRVGNASTTLTINKHTTYSCALESDDSAGASTRTGMGMPWPIAWSCMCAAHCDCFGEIGEAPAYREKRERLLVVYANILIEIVVVYMYVLGIYHYFGQY